MLAPDELRWFVAETDALAKGMEEKSREFKDKGAEIYQKV